MHLTWHKRKKFIFNYGLIMTSLFTGHDQGLIIHDQSATIHDHPLVTKPHWPYNIDLVMTSWSYNTQNPLEIFLRS